MILNTKGFLCLTKRIILSVFISCPITLFGYSTPDNQEPDGEKRIEARRTGNPPKIDGILDDEEWSSSPVATDFIIYIPDNGKPSDHRTEVHVLYDDVALYIGAFMYDDNPDSIYVQLGERDADRQLNADNFSVEVCPYNDGVNGFRFKVSASGVQSDGRIELFDFGGGGGSRRGGQGGGSFMGGGGGGGAGGFGMMGREDNWDAVWESEVSVNDKGWVAELKIPYSALRFPKEEVQTWGVNFWREVRRKREQSSWNYVNRDIGSTINHLGEMYNIKDIKPPLRLSLTPYVSGYLEKTTEEEAIFRANGGLDVKLGLSESFTIDATLVPDFGQVQSDDQVLNLTAYEVKYNEKRPFFMEGTELFSKGDIFYSRRVGAEPRLYESIRNSLDTDEVILTNPQEAGLINATKLSGRTRFGLGIGVFNGMTKRMYATIKDTLSGETHDIMTEPFTNYNMLVLDQNLGNNSYISLVNTNVWRDHPNDESFYTANVTGTDFDIRTANNMYSISGQAVLSQKYYDTLNNDFGHSYNMRIGKTGGAFRVEYGLTGISDTYDPNDMGYLLKNNMFMNDLEVSYNINRPFWRINSTRNSLSYSYSQLYSPRNFTRSMIRLSTFTTFRKFWSINLNVAYSPSGFNDYDEPRVDGRFFHTGPDLMTSLSYNSNRNKKVYINAMTSYTKTWSEYNQSTIMLSITPGIRFGDKLSLTHQLMYMKAVNDIGYVDDYDTGEIFFGIRDNKTVTNTLTAGYIFTADAYLSFRLRHYWSTADYNAGYYLLNDDGSLDPNTTYSADHNSNFNSFNIDMVYNWRFAPGSDLSVVWKNSIYSYGTYVYTNFGKNIKNMFESPQTNSISLKIIYYLDYQYLKKLR